MKNILLFFFVLCFCGSARAQSHTTNSILLSGSIGTNSYKVKNTHYPSNNFKNYSNNILVSAGYQFDEHWTAGATYQYSWQKNYSESGKSQYFSTGPFVRYNHQISGIFSLFGQLESGYRKENNYNTSVSLRVFPGIRMDIKNGFALNFSLPGIGFSSSKIQASDLRSNQFSIGAGGSAFQLGVSKNFSL